MTAHIHSWTDGYLALREHAFATRGLVELDTHDRWPRTTGGDVIAIAALFDPAVRTHGTPGVQHRWQGALADLERDALASTHETYPENRTFWASVEMTAIFLDDVAVTPPAPAIWDALLDQLEATEPRNAGPSADGPFGHFDARTYDDLYIAEYKYLRDKRGSDELAPPPGHTGAKKAIPRTTNADVIALATYWTKQLDAAKHVMGRDSTEAAWKVVLADIDKLAKPGKPDDVYAKNNEFWRELANVSIHVAVANEAPTNWDLAVASVKDSVTHLPENLSIAANKATDFVAEAAHAVGKVANEAGKGLFAGFGTPLLIGGGLIGLYLISRSRHHEES